MFSTIQVARLLGVSPSRLSRAVWLGNVKAPPRGPGGSFVWGRDDIIRAGWQLLGRDVSNLLEHAERKGGAL